MILKEGLKGIKMNEKYRAKTLGFCLLFQQTININVKHVKDIDKNLV